MVSRDGPIIMEPVLKSVKEMKIKSQKIVSSIGKKIFEKYVFEQNDFVLHIFFTSLIFLIQDFVFLAMMYSFFWSKCMWNDKFSGKTVYFVLSEYYSNPSTCHQR